MKRSIHEKINLRPQLAKAIYTAAKIKGENFESPEFATYTAIRSNKMVFL